VLPPAEAALGEPDPPEWANATWNAYLGVVVNATGESPVIQTVSANDLTDPLARGLCGHTRCHGMNDFIDVVIDKDGRPWAAFVDDCVDKCAAMGGTAADRTKGPGAGLVATLVSGPGLLASSTTLPALS